MSRTEWSAELTLPVSDDTSLAALERAADQP
jgi:hypothetical protein